MELHRLKQLIRLCSHDEIVFVKSSDLMRSPIDGYTPIFCNYYRMVIFFLGNCTDFVRKFQRLGKVSELENIRTMDISTHKDMSSLSFTISYGVTMTSITKPARRAINTRNRISERFVIVLISLTFYLFKT